MLNIDYTKDGKSFSDFECNKKAEEMTKDTSGKIFKVSSDNIVFALRVKIVEKKLDGLILYYNGKRVAHTGKDNQFAKIIMEDGIEYPEGFLDHYDKCLDKLLGLDKYDITIEEE